MKHPEQDIFINRELSWLDFDKRVLELAKEKHVPMGERLKFASIYASNLDEFFMVRVGSLYDCTLLQKSEKENKTGLTAQEQLNAIMPKVAAMQRTCDNVVRGLYADLEALGYKKVDFNTQTKEQLHFWKKYFVSELSPVLSPQIIDRRHPFPFLRNNEMYIGTMLKVKNETQVSFGLIPMSQQFGRIVFHQTESCVEFALVEELVLHFADVVFGKKAVQTRCIFRVTRNADLTAEEAMFDHDIDYRVVMSQLLKRRRKLAAVRLLVSEGTSQEVIAFLCDKLMLPRNQVFEQFSPLDLSIGFKLSGRIANENKPELFYPVRRPVQPALDFRLTQASKQEDVLLQYPYQSIRPFIKMLHAAANDPDVVSIKMTLYRMARDSKIVDALVSAAENGKEVVTIVELRARFDEQSNIDFSKKLEEAGCTVIYGFQDYKVHSKLCLITRKKDDCLEYISQIGTGNYNEKTSELYTDLSFITTNPEVGAELAVIFNNLAIETLTPDANHLLVAPLCFKSVLMDEMDREIVAKKKGQDAEIVIKCNSISDKDIIEKICEASNAGVRVKMIVRGICCIKAGVVGITENVEVRSILGRYLEHSRVYQFGTGDNARVYIASGDFLTRNTQRRVEAGVCVKQENLKKELVDLLTLQWADNVNAYEMLPDGSYHKVQRQKDEPIVDCQNWPYESYFVQWPEMPKAPQVKKEHPHGHSAKKVAHKQALRAKQQAMVARRKVTPVRAKRTTLLQKMYGAFKKDNL